MGDNVSFPSNGSTAEGYLATAAGSGSGPGVIVIQEWWGLVPHIRDVVDRFAGAGFTALAPDLYHGQTTTEPDEAGKLMMALNMGQAAKDISGAVDYLAGLDSTTSDQVGIVGFCMGGGLALYAATLRPDAIKACAPYYGLIPWPDAQPDWSKLDAVVRGHYAENDGSFPPAAVADLQQTFDDLGKDAVLTVHPGVDHAFFNDTRPEVYNGEQSAAAFADTVQLFRTAVG